MRELLDLATSHASGEEAVWANFDKNKDKATVEPMDEAKDHTRRGRDRRDRNSKFITSAERDDKEKTS